MGLMDSLKGLFGGEPDHPTLDPQNYATARLEEVRPQLEELMADVPDRLEVVPAEHAAYVFIGKPPDAFGLAWIHDGKLSNFKTLAKKHNVKEARLQRLSEHLREAYVRSKDAERFAYTLGERTLVVTPSTELEDEVHKFIDEVIGESGSS